MTSHLTSPSDQWGDQCWCTKHYKVTSCLTFTCSDSPCGSRDKPLYLTFPLLWQTHTCLPSKRASLWPYEALGCSKDGHSITPFSNVLPSSCRKIRDQTLVKRHGNVVLLLHEVNLLQDFLMPKVLETDGILHFCNNTRMITTWLPMRPVAKCKILPSNQSPGHLDLSHIVCAKYYS